MEKDRTGEGEESKTGEPQPALPQEIEALPEILAPVNHVTVLEELQNQNLLVVPGKPTTLPEISEFYFQYFKPLYFDVTTDGDYPAEVHYEVAAAFEHVARFYAEEDAEDYAVLKVHTHLKRACLDLFRIVLRDTKKLYDQLMEIDTSAVDNGEFDRKLIALWAQTKRLTRVAKVSEGSKRDLSPEEVFRAFEKWVPVYDNCVAIQQHFHQNPNVDWARKRNFKTTPTWVKVSAVAGVIIAIAAVLNIIKFLREWF